MKNLSTESTSPAAIALSVEEWFDTYGVAIMKREEAKQHRSGVKAMGKAAGAR